MAKSFFCFVTAVHAFDRQTERETDISLMAKTALHRCSAVIKQRAAQLALRDRAAWSVSFGQK